MMRKSRPRVVFSRLRGLIDRLGHGRERRPTGERLRDLATALWGPRPWPVPRAILGQVAYVCLP